MLALCNQKHKCRIPAKKHILVIVDVDNIIRENICVSGGASIVIRFICPPMAILT